MGTRNRKQTLYQLSSLISVAVMAVWGIVILWLYFFKANVTDVGSSIPLISLTLVFVLVLPFSAFRLRWSYAASVVPFLGLLTLVVVQALEISHFAFTVRTVATIVIAIIAVMGLIASVLAFRATSGKGWWKAVTGAAVAVAVIAISFVVLSGNTDALQRLRATWTQARIERQLARLDSLDEKIHFLQREGGLPTLAAGIVVKNELTWDRTFGEQAPVGPIFNIGSVTKSLVATAVMQLVERGQLDLDADISQYLPFELRHPEAPTTPITARMLLTHRSGLSHYTPVYASFTEGASLLDWLQDEYGGTIYGDISDIDPQLGFGEFIASYVSPNGAYYSSQAWSSRPGRQYTYSTPGYDLLGLIVSEIAGMPFEEYLMQHLLVPLGMSDTGLPLDELPDRRAIPYDCEAGALFQASVAMPCYDRRIIGAGGLTSTVFDLSRFVIAHLNGGEVGGTRILTRETVEDMHSLRVVSTADIGMTGYGYGFNTMCDEPWEYYGHSYNFNGSVGHGGKDYGYMSRLFFVPSGTGGYGSIILTNRSDFLDSDMTWFFGIILKIENLLLEEARSQFEGSSPS